MPWGGGGAERVREKTEKERKFEGKSKKNAR
jgi:hypothetical protein